MRGVTSLDLFGIFYVDSAIGSDVLSGKMPFRNKIAVNCSVCRELVPVGTGWSEKVPNGWQTKCNPCSGIVEAPKTILIGLEGHMVTIKPSGYLNGQFQAYRTACEGATYDGTRNTIPVAKAGPVLQRLKDANFILTVSKEASEAIQGSAQSAILSVQEARVRADQIDKILQDRGLFLYPYQRQGVEWLAGRQGALLADDMGLGKTIQIITALPENAPVVIVCPALVKGVWQREISKWRPELKITVLSGRGSFRWPAANEVIIVNYDILPNAKMVGYEAVLYPEFLKDCPEGTILVADEAHLLKDPKSLRVIRFRGMSNAVRKIAGRTWLATGTPLLNRAPELWCLLQAAGLATEAFGSFSKFSGLMGGHQGKFGMEWGSVQDPVAVGECLRKVMLRRLKSEVLTQLPTKTYRTIPVEIDAKLAKICDKVLSGFEQKGISLENAIETLRRTDGLAFDEMARARSLLAAAKVKTLMEFVESFEEQAEPLLVFSAHRAPIDNFIGRQGWAVITGDTAPEERTEIEDRFQRGELRGIASTIKAGGVGITLTRACHVLFIDRLFTPAENEQAEDRVNRIGQTRGIFIHDLIADHALDRRVHELLTQKQEIIKNSVEMGRVDASAPVAISRPAEVDFEALANEARLQAEAADKAREEAEALAKAREAEAKEKFEKLDRERSEAEAKEKAERKAEKNKAKRLANAKARGWVAEENNPERRGPEGAREEWAASALAQLTALDPDGAMVENEVGFNKADSYIGHWLCQEIAKGLTPKQWDLVIKLCSKYRGQVGSPPSV